MIAKNRDQGDGQAEYKLMMKGAPEKLILICSKILTKNGVVELSQQEGNAFQVN